MALLEIGLAGPEGILSSSTGGAGVTGERGDKGGVLMSLLSSSGSVFDMGDFVFSGVIGLGLVGRSRFGGGTGLGFLLKNDLTLEADVGGTGDGDGDGANDADVSIESGESVDGTTGACSGGVRAGNFGFTRGINCSIPVTTLGKAVGTGAGGSLGT